MKYSEYAKMSEYTNKARENMDAWREEVRRLRDERATLEKQAETRIDTDLIKEANKKGLSQGTSINKSYKEKANDLKKLANTRTQSDKMATKEELQSAISELKRSAERDLTNYISRGRRTHETNNTYKEIRKRWLDRITTRANGRSGDSTTY